MKLAACVLLFFGTALHADSFDDLSAAEAAVREARAKDGAEGPACAGAIQRLLEAGRKATAEADKAATAAPANDPGRLRLVTEALAIRKRFADALFHSVALPRVEFAELSPVTGSPEFFDDLAARYAALHTAHAELSTRTRRKDDGRPAFDDHAEDRLRLQALVDGTIAQARLRRAWCLLWAARGTPDSDKRRQRLRAALDAFTLPADVAPARRKPFDFGAAVARFESDLVSDHPLQELRELPAAQATNGFRAAVLWESAHLYSSARRHVFAVSLVDRIAVLQLPADNWHTRHAPLLKLRLLNRMKLDARAAPADGDKASAAALEKTLIDAGRIAPSAPDGSLRTAAKPAGAARAWPGITPSAVEGEPGFWGLELGATGSVVYVIDRSGSMDPVFDSLKGELARAFRRLGANRKLNFIWFADGEPYKLATALVPAVPRNFDFVLKFIAQVPCRGSTQPPRDALTKALAMKPEAVILVTDEDTDPALVDQFIAKAKAPIHVIHVELEAGKAPANLMRLAEGTKGRFVSVPLDRILNGD